MKKYRIDYKLFGLGNFFVEAPSVGQAYEKMYESFETDNSLIVRAKFPYGFEIRRGVIHEGDFPKPSSIFVTTVEDLKKARILESLGPVAIPTPKFADSGLFEFESNSEDQEHLNKKNV
ncbi:hypothetical protein [Zwartia sp.]|uniref:hypothetical protein n=1 Tax=Zwartia sp. TaxID=2978004 RepID=UPI00271C7013|nr:hypothetical protein [Zwartia sp.]MDO9025290.1 hypothetical protein [Zwartia sp.]